MSRKLQQLWPDVLRLYILLVLSGIVSLSLLVFLWQVRPPVTYTLNVGDPNANVSQFYGPELSGSTPFRWSKDLSAVSVPALATSQQISVIAGPGRSEGILTAKLQLLSGDKLLGQFVLQPGWQTSTVTVSSGLGPDIRLVLESDTFYPDPVTDRRRLGVAVATVQSVALPGKLGIVLPPWLWLLVGLLCWFPTLPFLFSPSVAPEKARWHSRNIHRLRLIGIATLAALVPPALAALLPEQIALPTMAWLWGLASGASVLLLIWRWRGLLPGSSFMRSLANFFRPPYREVLAVAIGSAALSVLMTWPLVTRLGDSLPGWPGDNFAFLYKFWWFRTALFVTHQSPFFDPNTFAPFGFNMGQGEPTPLNTVPGAAIGVLVGDIASYNLIALASFVVSALGAYLLVREITGNRVGAALAAIAFAFAPYHMSQFAGHIQLMGTGWIALTFYFVEKSFRTRHLRDGIFCGLALGAAALSAWYYAFITVLALVVYVVARLASMYILRKKNGTERLALMPLIRSGLAAVIAFAIVSLPVALPSLSLWGSGLLRHTAHRADASSAAPADYIIPNELQPAWGEPGMEAHSEENVIESSLSLGVIVPGIALVGWLVGRRKPKRKQQEAPDVKTPPVEEATPGRSGAITWPWIIVLVVTFVLSLGLVLHDTVGEVQFNGGTVSLPGSLLFDWLPLFASMRAYARFGVVTLLAAVVLMGLGWRRIALRWPQHSLRLGLLAVVLLLADFWTVPYAWGTSRVVEDPSQAFVQSLEPGNVMEVPLASAQNGVSLYSEVYYGKPITYGYDTFQPPEWRVQLVTLTQFPADNTLDLLKTWNVRYIVVSGNAYGADWPATLTSLRKSPRLKYLGDFTRPRVWDVDPAVLDARPDMAQYVQPDDRAVFELVR